MSHEWTLMEGVARPVVGSWIPVSEGLPANASPVLVWHADTDPQGPGGGEVSIGQYYYLANAIRSDSAEWSSEARRAARGCIGPVTHWMPLPNDPKKGIHPPGPPGADERALQPDGIAPESSTWIDFRREKIATAALQGIIGGFYTPSGAGEDAGFPATPDAAADLAVQFADALIARLAGVPADPGGAATTEREEG